MELLEVLAEARAQMEAVMESRSLNFEEALDFLTSQVGSGC